jgi:hypothetical protein
MIDVSQLTHLQATIVLLIERRKESGIRVCELTKEINASNGSIKNNLATLLKQGYIFKIIGDVPRYFVPSVSPVVPSVSPVVPSVSENSEQLTNYNYFKQTQQTNKKDFEKELKELLNTFSVGSALPTKQNPPQPPPQPPRQKTKTKSEPTPEQPQDPPQKQHTKLVSVPKQRTTTTVRRDMPTITLPTNCPKTGSFDGWIFATELPREGALDRMLERLGFDTQADNALITRYELFKTVEIIIFDDFRKQDKKKLVFDDVVQRFAFAVAMETPEFPTIDELKKYLKNVMPKVVEKCMPGFQHCNCYGKYIIFNNGVGMPTCSTQTQHGVTNSIGETNPVSNFFPQKNMKQNPKIKTLK